MRSSEYIELERFPSGTNTESLNAKSALKNKYNFTNTQLQFILSRLGEEVGDEIEIDEEVGGAADIQLSRSAEFLIDKISMLSNEVAVEILRNALVELKDDVNFPHQDYRLLERLVNTIPQEEEEEEEDQDELKTVSIEKWSLEARVEAALIHYHSPYPEIRAITDPFDDPDVPVETLRCYVIGLGWTFIGSVINSFFIHRMPRISLSSHTIQILLYPCGKLWERVIPKKKLYLGKNYVIDLNPGPWTYKEMMLSTIIYSCSAGVPYSIYNIFVMKLDKFYGLKWVSLTFQILLTVSTQFLGFAFAMIMKKVCVFPSRSIWPTVLPTIALNRALMNEDANNTVHGWKISRYMFFIIVSLCSFVWNWVPNYLFQALSNFNWPTWFNHKSIHLTNIAGTKMGLGLNPLPTFDWNQIDSGACLTIPFYTYVNRYLGTFLGFILILVIYYTNNYFTAYLPINSNHLFNNKAKEFNVHDILNNKSQFDNSKYQEVGPPYFSAANLVVYGAYFCLYPFAILYMGVLEWTSMKNAFGNVWTSLVDAFKRKTHNEHRQLDTFSEDPHCKMMAKYKDVPDWWFIAIFVVSTLFAISAVLFYPVETPIWGVLFTILINFIFLIPITAIASVTGFSFGLNVLVELIVGYAIPNSGLALITLKAFGYNIDSQASNYITDQKIAHYSKVPPRAIFKGQLISTLLNIIVSLSIANWQLTHIPDICQIHQRDNFSCPGANTYFFASIQYGEIGPAKVFGGLYPILKWCFLLGALLVIPSVWFKKKANVKLTRYFQPTIIIGGFLDFAPYNLAYFTSGLYLSFIFMYSIKKHYLLWWEKYNYILTSALSAGVAFSALLIFFTVQYNSHELKWWGNSVSRQGIEGGELPDIWKDISTAPDGYIGLRKGHYP
ncbi:OPT6 [Candida oxycetoniae]|uniref:OPT6 n=1 Tax=Candida oxycetoniae TaxID=497107 RepID=A0AAI9X091_9ASCO|nr:OPT6 [Candida oxycetoniae]KAI3406700.2 OPT6 [Candida oxycetoniae]